MKVKDVYENQLLQILNTFKEMLKQILYSGFKFRLQKGGVFWIQRKEKSYKLYTCKYINQNLSTVCLIGTIFICTNISKITTAN